MPDKTDQKVLLEGDASDATAVGITVEPDGGSPSPARIPSPSSSSPDPSGLPPAARRVRWGHGRRSPRSDPGGLRGPPPRGVPAARAAGPRVVRRAAGDRRRPDQLAAADGGRHAPAARRTPGQHVLDVGAGSGWTTALLGHLVGPTGRVRGVELLGDLVTFARANLARSGPPWVSVEAGAPGGAGPARARALRPGAGLGHGGPAAGSPALPARRRRRHGRPGRRHDAGGHPGRGERARLLPLRAAGGRT